MTETWSVEGLHVVSCNCAFGCPCQFVALPSDGTCKAVVGFIFEKGHYGDTVLDGLMAVNTYDWPGAIHEGNGVMQTIVDERADEAQRKGLAAVMQGEGAEPGSTMLTIYRAMCKTCHDTVTAPIEIELDMEGRKGRIEIPGMVTTAIEPLKNPVTGAEHRARIDLPMGKEFRIAEVASGTTKASGAVPLEFANSHAHFARSSLTSSGLSE